MTSQLVVDLKGDVPQFRLEANRSGRPPADFQRPNDKLFVPHFGSQDLVRLADYLVASQKYKIESFRIAYPDYHRLDPEHESQLSTELLSFYRTGGVRSLLKQLDGDYSGYVVLGVKLIDPNLSALLVQRNGILKVEKGIDFTAIMDDAWMELELS